MKSLKLEASINEEGEMFYSINKSKSMNFFELVGLLNNIAFDVNKMIEEKLKIVRE